MISKTTFTIRKIEMTSLIFFFAHEKSFSSFKNLKIKITNTIFLLKIHQIEDL